MAGHLHPVHPCPVFPFHPWCYRAAAETRSNVEKSTALADRNERRLIRGLLNAGAKDGVVGATAGTALKNLPSALYWGGMRVHGILNDATLNRDDAIAAEVARIHTRRPPAINEFEDAAAVWHAGAFHATLPPMPAGFPAEVTGGFDMPNSEAAWLRDRMLDSSPDTMLEHALHHRPDAESAVPWEDSVLMSADGERRNVLEDARRFSVLMNSASLLYNLLLAEEYEEEGFDRVDNPVETYRQRIDEWASQATVQDDINNWNIADFWSRVLHKNPGVNPWSRRFIDDWLDLLGLRPRFARRQRGHARVHPPPRTRAQAIAGEAGEQAPAPIVARIVGQRSAGLPVDSAAPGAPRHPRRVGASRCLSRTPVRR